MFSTAARSIPRTEHWWRFQEDCSMSAEQQRWRSDSRTPEWQQEWPGDWWRDVLRRTRRQCVQVNR